MREIYYAGAWLSAKLGEQKCDPELIRRICFAHGQRCCVSGDVWRTTLEVLDRYRRGDVDEPGFLLSQKLREERGAT